MSEYIYGSVKCECIPEYRLERREEIVRCKDCVFYDERELRNFKTRERIGTDCCCERNEYVVDVEPDGFCAWASRKENTQKE